MRPNMGTADRIIRILVAVAITVMYFTGILTGTLGIVLMILAAVLVLTGLVGFCPLYATFGIKTCKAQ